LSQTCPVRTKTLEVGFRSIWMLDGHCALWLQAQLPVLRGQGFRGELLTTRGRLPPLEVLRGEEEEPRGELARSDCFLILLHELDIFVDRRRHRMRHGRLGGLR